MFFTLYVEIKGKFSIYKGRRPPNKIFSKFFYKANKKVRRLGSA